MRINLSDFQDRVKRENSDGNDPRFENEKFGQIDRIKKRSGFKKFCACCFLAIIIIIIIIYGLVRFVVGPVVQNINSLPGDFPKEFALYKIENAKIQAQTPQSREKLLKILKSTPNWLIVPFWDYLSNNLKLKLAENFGKNINLPSDFSVSDFKNILNSNNLDKTKTISISWRELDKTKEELLSFYKQELAKAGYEYKENLGDYKIDLGFWKENVFGQMSFKDSGKGTDKSIVEMMINYIKP